MEGTAKDRPWVGQFTDEPDELPEFVEFLQDVNLSYKKLSEISGVPASTIGRWVRGSLNPKYGRAVKVLNGLRRHFRERLEDVAGTRRAVQVRHDRVRDRTRDAEISAEWRSGEDGPRVVVEGEEREVVDLDCLGPVTYLLLRDGEVVYVGHSTNLFGRLGNHQRNKDFDRFAYIQFETKTKAIEVERALREQLDPEYNLK